MKSNTWIWPHRCIPAPPIPTSGTEEEEDTMETYSSGSMRLTPLAKTFVAAAIVGVTALIAQRLHPGYLDQLFPAEKRQGSLVPESVALPAPAPQGPPAAAVELRPPPGKE